MDWKEFYKKVDELMSESKSRDIILEIIMQYQINTRDGLMQRIGTFALGLRNFRDYKQNDFQQARKKFQEECGDIKSGGYDVIINFTKKRIFNNGDVIKASATSENKKRSLNFSWLFYNIDTAVLVLRIEGEDFICPVTKKIPRGYYNLTAILIDKDDQIHGTQKIENILID
ncbi:MAG: hypothetical protein AABW52_04635 [Nanoarchaeota archaeon]